MQSFEQGAAVALGDELEDAGAGVAVGGTVFHLVHIAFLGGVVAISEFLNDAPCFAVLGFRWWLEALAVGHEVLFVRLGQIEREGFDFRRSGFAAIDGGLEGIELAFLIAGEHALGIPDEVMAGAFVHAWLVEVAVLAFGGKHFDGGDWIILGSEFVFGGNLALLDALFVGFEVYHVGLELDFVEQAS